NKSPLLSLNYDNLGDVHFDLTQLDSSLYYYQQAIATTVGQSLKDSRVNLPLDTLAESNNQTGLITYLTSKAKALHHIYLRDHKQADLDLSRETYEFAINLIDRLRKEFQDADSKLFLLNEAMDTYEGAIAAALSAGDVARAFQISEKSKSTLLYTAMRGQQAKSYAQIPEDLLEEEYFLNEEIAYLEHQLSARADETELMTRLTIAKTQLEQLVKEIETAYPEYYRLKYDTQPIDLGFLQESLPEQTYLVEFFTGEGSTYIFVIDKGQIQVERIASREADVQAWVQQLHDNRLEENFYATGHSLYQDFFQSFDLEAGHHLLIVPDGQLNYLPFGALLSQPVTAEQRPSQYDYLIQRHPISYSFSAKLWQWTTQQEKSFAPFQKNLLVFAPDFQKVAPARLSVEDQGYLYDPFFGGRPAVQVDAALSPLRVLKTGARNLSAELDGNFYPNEQQDALLGRFIDIAKQYRIIHLTTHGSSNKDNNRYSYLAFRPTEDSIDNERLYLADLYRLELNADMVVLAACETNLGELHPGEGNASLAQGFTYAGARSIVATLWQVNEASTSDLMQAFYQYLQEGKDKATALQLAKQDLIANAGDYPTPYYWAAPIVIGDTEPIDFQPMWILYAMIGGFVLLLVLMIGILRRRRS
ncbi:MAG: CHAT domain-containing protein, partial [Bacteroidota bacterium]